MKQNFKKGFTLIELLVVIAIIGILAAITVVSVQGPRNKAQDTKTLSELRQVASIMEQYWGDKQSYNDTGAELTGWNTGTNSLETMLEYLGTPLPSNNYLVSANGATTALPDDATDYCLYKQSLANSTLFIQCEKGANCTSAGTAAGCQ